MDVRAMQEPLKAGYRRDPGSGRITLTARGAQAGGPIACSVDLRRAVYEAIRLAFAVDAPGAS